MKCTSCGSKWEANPKFIQVIKCPFCGANIIQDNVYEEITAINTVKNIIKKKNGKENRNE